jgi:hypothetical protein
MQRSIIPLLDRDSRAFWNGGVPSRRSSGACATRSRRGIRRSQTISGLDIFGQFLVNGFEVELGVQQCERMATWAFRMCLL